jgi:midasin
VFRQRSNIFSGKEGVITVRDLIKWGKREITCIEDLAYEGYFVLAEKMRTIEEREFIKNIIIKHTKVNLDLENYYKIYLEKNLKDSIEDFPYFI